MSADRPSPEPLESSGPVRPSVVVLPAVAFEPPFDERSPWLDRLPIEAAYEIPGADGPLYVTDPDGGLAITTTGLGKAPAATTVAALQGAAGLDLSGTYWLSAGIAGAAPDRAAIGSVFVADAVLDWDRKHRWDPDEVGRETADAGATEGAALSAVEQLAYLPADSLFEPDPALVDMASEIAEGVELGDRSDVCAYQDRYPAAPDHGPRTAVGPTVTSDEFWHGSAVAREVESLCTAYGIDPYATTQMEDAATATALARFDAADRYLSLRAVANYDRPAPGETVHESFEGTAESVDLARENVARVGVDVVEKLCELAAR